MKNVVLQTLSDSQRAFVTAAESLGATTPATARTGGELPRLSARELVQLLDTGIVRESAEGAFYVYDRARPVSALSPTPRDARARRRWLIRMVILFILLLIPILFLRLSASAP